MTANNAIKEQIVAAKASLAAAVEDRRVASEAMDELDQAWGEALEEEIGIDLPADVPVGKIMALAKKYGPVIAAFFTGGAGAGALSEGGIGSLFSKLFGG